MPEKFERENLDSSENQPEDLKEQGPVLSDQEMAEIERKANEAKESEPQTSEELTEKIEKLKESFEEEQTPEEILAVLQEAAEQGQELTLTIARSDGTLDTGLGIPYFTDEGFYVETDYGAIPIDINRVKKAEK